ncbi:hypothetical protein FIBSPDRAFT_571741 [Athelia psychrophila]|uniref:Uncharacterized protein n=1 Tax=Athelia psychrophila TaxID=1759441 RepID=A0A167T9I7_9AGAM|nr:hypothetical protein FIBSPDRAFT_571741 [Fibularhizoctonia sp. CBS 109695]
MGTWPAPLHWDDPDRVVKNDQRSQNGCRIGLEGILSMRVHLVHRHDGALYLNSSPWDRGRPGESPHLTHCTSEHRNYGSSAITLGNVRLLLPMKTQRSPTDFTACARASLTQDHPHARLHPRSEALAASRPCAPSLLWPVWSRAPRVGSPDT